jgi:hypothetical protein
VCQVPAVVARRDDAGLGGQALERGDAQVVDAGHRAVQRRPDEDGIGRTAQKPDDAGNGPFKRQRHAQGRRLEEADLRARPDLSRDEPADIATVTGTGRTVETLRDGDRYRQTAGQGLEPQLPEPESGVLPITPPGNGSALQYRTPLPDCPVRRPSARVFSALHCTSAQWGCPLPSNDEGSARNARRR